MKPDQVPDTDRKYVRQIVLLTALCAVATLVSSTSGPVFAAEEGAVSLQDAGNPSFCETAGDCEIPYQYLSSEETDPYLVSGEPPNKRADVRAAARWPDARSCLVREERIAEKPDIAKIDWKRMRREEDIEVCMFRIAASLDGPERMADWFRAQGMSNSTVKKYEADEANLAYAEAFNFFHESQRSYLATWSAVSRSLRISTMFNESFNAVWMADGRLTSTGYETTTK